MNKKLLYEILNVQSKSYKDTHMIFYILDVLNKNNIKHSIDYAGNIIAEKGDAEFKHCLCAHTDTVHEIVSDYAVAITSENIAYAINPVTGKRVGVGGDDKCGIFIALSCILNPSIKNLKCVFFANEEVGCAGSTFIDLKVFDDCVSLIQFDRRHGYDYINAGTSLATSNEFEDAIAPFLSKYNYKETDGLTTDVFKLSSRGVGISCVNMSCGYYEPHTSTEYIKIDELENSLNLAVDIILNMPSNKRYEHKPTPKQYTYPKTTVKTVTYPAKKTKKTKQHNTQLSMYSCICDNCLHQDCLRCDKTAYNY